MTKDDWRESRIRKLRVISTVTLVKSADPAIAGVADRHKLGEMIFEKRLWLLRVDCGSWRQSLIRLRSSFHGFTLHGITLAQPLAQAIFSYTYLSISASESTMP